MKNRWILFFTFLILIISNSHSQKETANWYFGVGAGLSFANGTATPIFDGKLQTIEGSASISDRNGNLLFYTDGSTVYDRSHNIMQNGTDLKGNVSSTQSAIIIPNPSNPGRYYIFTVDKPDYFRVSNDPIEGVHFSEVDMSLNNGNGGIVNGQKNIHLITYDQSSALEKEFKSSEKITAVIAGDCISYWVVTQLSNKFYSFRVSSSGVNTDPVISTVSTNHPPLINENDINVTAPGYMKISPDGTKLAAAFSGTALGSPRTGGAKKTGKVYLYDFNDVTGRVSNSKLLLAEAYPYGIEFSPESQKLYVTSNVYSNSDILQSSELYQFNLEALSIQASKTVIHSSRNVAGALQLALDGKIYRAGYSTDGGYVEWNLLSVINQPEEAPGAVDYDHNSIDISPRDVKLGLPPFVQSLFSVNFEYENICLGKETNFSLEGTPDYDSLLWEFGDGSTSAKVSPDHTYTEAGTYVVTLTRTINNIPQDPVCKEITIFNIADIPANYILKQCDVRDNNPNDGLAEFNLQLAKEDLTEGDTSLQLYFYESRSAAENDDLNENSLNNIFRNNTPGQKLFAKVTGFGSNCYNITSFELQTTGSTALAPGPASGCDTGDGKAEFNLETIEANILTELGLDAAVNLTFYENEDDSFLGGNALPVNFRSEPKTIYIRADNAGFCYGFGSIELTMTSLPEILTSNELSGCGSAFPMEIGNTIGITNTGDYSYAWSTGDDTQTISVNESGEYILNLTNKEFGCAREIIFNIQKFEAPQITDIRIENHGEYNDIDIVTNSTDNDILYSLDNKNGPFQTSPLFTNVPGGPHTVFVKNDKACEVAQAEVFLFGFPQYFTPNNDGYHDLWRPYDISELQYGFSRIVIYDRYGKVLVQLPANTKGWDGNFNGRPMPSNDYWFEVTLKNGRVFKGHFSLVRKN